MNVKTDKKLLPIDINPFIKTYPYNGFYLGILSAHDIDITDLLLNDFTHVFYYKNHKKGHLDFTGSGYVEQRRFNMGKLNILNKSEDDIINILIEYIISDHYIMVNLNEKYILNETINQNFDYCHDWMVCGYDNFINAFICVGYVGPIISERVFNKFEIPYNEFVLAFKNVSPSFIHFKPLKLRNHIVSINWEWIEPKNTIARVRKRFLKRYRPYKIFLYNKLVTYIDTDAMKAFINSFYDEHLKIYEIVETEINDRIFLQDFRTIYEQKKIVQLYVGKITQDNELIYSYDKVVKEAYSNLLLCLKYNMKPKKELAIRIYNLMIKIENEEYKIVEKMLNIHLNYIKNKLLCD